MIRAAVERTLDALFNATGLDARKLEQLQTALEVALTRVKNARFKCKQEAFKSARSF